MTKSLFSVGFRPFFILCALTGLICPLLWTLILNGHLEMNTIYSSGLAWHAHEMLFGVTLALIAGFLLTAGSVWTNRPPLQGKPLKVLVFLYLVERIIPFLNLNKSLSIVIIMIFSISLLGSILWLLRGNRNQMIISPILSIIVISKLLFLIGDFYFVENLYEYGRHFGLIAILLLIITFSGRVVPMFSAPHLGFRPIVPNWINRGSIITVIFLLIPFHMLTKPLHLFILLSTITFNILRLYYWRPIKCLKNSLISVLHIGQTFFIIGILLIILEQFNIVEDTNQMALHSFSVGTLGVFAIGIMLRVTKGHTGREIKSDRMDKIIIHAVYLCCLFRILLPYILNFEYNIFLLWNAAFFWGLAFFLYLARYVKVLTNPRLDK